MGKLQNDQIYTDLKALEEKLLNFNGKIPDDLYNSYAQKIAKIKQELIDLPDSADISLINGVIQKVVELEFDFDNNVSKKTKETIKQSLLSQLDLVEQYISKDLEMVEEIVAKVDKKLVEAKDVYDNVEYDQIEQRLLSLLIKCNIERAKNKKEIDVKNIDRLLNDNGYSMLRNLLAKKGQERSGLEKVLIESWQTEIIDIKTGLLDKKRVDEIIKKPKFWEVLSGVKEIEYVKEGREVSLESSSTFNNISEYDKIRQKQIEKISTEYGIDVKDLIPKEGEVIEVVEKEKKGQPFYKLHKKKFTKWANAYRGTNNVVACIFANDITKVDHADHRNGGFLGVDIIFYSADYSKLKDLVLPAELEEIYVPFEGSQIESIYFPKSTKSIFGGFKNCSKLKVIVFDEIFSVGYREGLKYIGQNAFEGTAVEELTFPRSLTDIQYKAFCNCSNLSQVNLNEGLEEIANEAFQGTNLKNVTIPYGCSVYAKTFPKGCAIEFIEDRKEDTVVEAYNKASSYSIDSKKNKKKLQVELDR